MATKKHIFRAGFTHTDHSHQNPTIVTIVAADFSEALKKAEAPETAALAGGKDDPVELVSLKRGESVDVE